MADGIELALVLLHNLPEHNIIVGQSHFIKTVEDIHEAMVNAVPGAQFGVAFAEASGDCLIRHSGTEKGLVDEAVRMVQAIGAGHSFVIVMKGMYPINVLTRLKEVPELVTLYCATANPVQVIVAQTAQGRGIIGVIDGGEPVGIEKEHDIKEREGFLRKIGYKK